MITFEEAWAKKEAAGYQYGQDALEQVRVGWDLAMEARADGMEFQFEREWAKGEAKGIQYGSEAMRQVRFGWMIAMEERGTPKPVPDAIARARAEDEEWTKREVIVKAARDFFKADELYYEARAVWAESARTMGEAEREQAAAKARLRAALVALGGEP